MNIPVLPFVGPEGRRRLGYSKKGYRFKDAWCPYFFRARRGRENASSQSSGTRHYNAEVIHTIFLGKARMTFNKWVPVPEIDTGIDLKNLK